MTEWLLDTTLWFGEVLTRDTWFSMILRWIFLLALACGLGIAIHKVF